MVTQSPRYSDEDDGYGSDGDQFFYFGPGFRAVAIITPRCESRCTWGGNGLGSGGLCGFLSCFQLVMILFIKILLLFSIMIFVFFLVEFCYDFWLFFAWVIIIITIITIYDYMILKAYHISSFYLTFCCFRGFVRDFTSAGSDGSGSWKGVSQVIWSCIVTV